MDVFLTRAEIRQRILEFTGYSTDGTVSASAQARVNRWIDMAASMVAEKSRWLSLRRRATIRVGAGGVTWGAVEQARWLEQQYPSLYNPATYGTAADTWSPSDLGAATTNVVGPAGLIEAAWWDDLVPGYRPMSVADTPAQYDTNRHAQYPREVELASIAAGDTSAETAAKVSAATADMTAQTGEPISIRKTATGIELWPVPDTPKVVRLVYDVSPEWMSPASGLTASQLDSLVSSVDAIAIVYLATAEQFAMDGDDTMAGRMEARAGARIVELRGRSQTGEVVELDSTTTFRDFSDYQRTPNWQRAR